MVEFIVGQTAAVAHDALVSSLNTQEKARQCSLMWFKDIYHRKLFLDLGYGTIKHYATAKLGLSRSQFYSYKKLILKMEKLPVLKNVVESGKVDLTKVQAVLSVIDEKNEKEWLEQAQKQSRRQLQSMVNKAKEAARKITTDEKAGQIPLLPRVPKHTVTVAVAPVQVRATMSSGQFSKYEALWEKIRKLGMVSSDQTEAMLEVLAFYVEENKKVLVSGEIKKSCRQDFSFAGKPSAVIHIHKCPECESATVQTSKGELQISQAEYDQAECDSIVTVKGKRNVSSIPPSIRQLSLEKARHQCQRKGCQHTCYLEVHHIVPRSNGGSNKLENLVCLCSACHRLLHQGKWMLNQAIVKDEGAVYQWRINKKGENQLSILPNNSGQRLFNQNHTFG